MRLTIFGATGAAGIVLVKHFDRLPACLLHFREHTNGNAVRCSSLRSYLWLIASTILSMFRAP